MTTRTPSKKIRKGGAQFEGHDREGAGATRRMPPIRVLNVAEKPSVVYDGATFYYEDLLDGKGQTWSGPQKELTPRAPERKINRSLIVGTTQSFADAFSLVIASDSIESKGSFIGAPSAPTATGIATYAAIARVIYDEIMPPGETLNLNA